MEMGKGKTLKMVVLAVLAVAALLQITEAQTTHVVGDALGWTVPPGGASTYSTWASSKTFSVGDVLVFNYTTGFHDVAEVTKAAFDACNSNGPISISTTGPTNITLSTAAEHYYICTFGSHCTLGQKLAINVSAAAPAPAPTPPPAPQPPTPTPTPTPSPSSPTPSAPTPVPTPPAATPTPSTSASPAPTPSTSASPPVPTPSTTVSPPAPTPGTGTPPPSTTNAPSSPSPSGSTAPPPPPPNSAPSLAAAALPVTLLSIVVALLR